MVRNPSIFRVTLFVCSWVFLRFVDFFSGFVGYSTVRLLIAAVLPLVALLPYQWATTKLSAISILINSTSSNRQITRLSNILWLGGLLTLSLIGYTLFFSRLIHNANMGDTGLFDQSIVSTARFQGVLFNDAEGGSHFRAHNSPFLFLFVPLVWVLGNYNVFLIGVVQSLVIVLWCYLAGSIISKLFQLSRWRWPLSVLLFLALYTQHMTFYDTRFAALGLLLFFAGLWQYEQRLIWAGFVIALLARETAVLTMVVVAICMPKTNNSAPVRPKIIVIGVVWIIATALLIHALGGPVSTGRFDSCLKSPQLTSKYVECIVNSIGIDWPLKLAYTLRMLSFGPMAAMSISAIAGIAPEMIFTWVSKDNVLYNLAWHYYMQILSLVMIFSIYRLCTLKRPQVLHRLYIRWILATCLWQFFTTFHPRLFF
jgi:uncharacterized membrane protein